PSSTSSTHCSRLPRSDCDGTARTTSSAPERASAGSVDAVTLAGRTIPGRYFPLLLSSLISAAASPRRAHLPTSEPASARTLPAAVPHVPAPITALRPIFASRLLSCSARPTGGGS